MNAPDLTARPPLADPTSWTEANRLLLVAEFTRLKALLRGEPDPEADLVLTQRRAELTQPAAVDQLAELFGLSGFERDLLLLAAAVEMDGEVARLCAAAPAGPQRPWASFGLGLAVLPEPHWSALTPTRALRRWRLLETADDTALVNARLRIDERVLHALAGIQYLDPRLQPLLRPVPVPELLAPCQRTTAEAVVAWLGDQPPTPLPLIQLWGRDLAGQRDVAATVAAHLGLSLFALRAEDIPTALHESDALATLWEREAALQGAALLIEAADGPAPAAVRFVQRVAGLSFCALREPVATTRPDRRYPVDKPGRLDQLALWQQALGNAGTAALMPALETLAAQMHLSAEDIRRTADELLPSLASAADPARLLRQACRRVSQPRLGALAQRIESQAGWDDLILAAPVKDLLRQIVSQVRHQVTVYDHWGFGAKSSRGLGISALFAGESGTGKTLAAEVLANELQLDLYRIDLSAVVSKYIGETEKNLARVFDAAEDSGAILLFDEADALFGKRSEVRDSHDRYANIEVSYLLQRMEAYSGLAILTTNQRTALDGAFLRRLRFVVTFPLPDAPAREAIWRSVFPVAMPQADLDFTKLSRLAMAGGSIRNIALNAAFITADVGSAMRMDCLLRSAHGEADKRQRAITESETRGWV